MTDEERYAAGLVMRRTVLGDAHVDAALARTTDLTDDLQDLITRYAWGEIWEEFRMHAAAVVREGGFTVDDLKEIVLQQAIYCGVPAAHHACTL